jgi:hypothetical protein
MSKVEKLARLHAALGNKEGDRVPISDFFWTGFSKNACKLWGDGCDLYRKFDLDYIVINPNMDPVIKDFELLRQAGEDVVVKTGFGATVMRRADLPMPHFDDFSVKSSEEMADFIIEPARDKRRLYKAGQDHINCLGDQLLGPIPSWSDRVEAYTEDFPVFGSVCEGFEYLWRCTGTINALMWMLEDEESFAAFLARIGDFLVEFARVQAEDSRISGMYIWGDVAYVSSMMFSPELWRMYFKPIVKRIVEVCHDAGLMTIYHGCGNASLIYEDFIETGIDGYNPLEVKAGLDAVKLKEQFGGRLAFVGNIDVRELESGDKNRIAKEVLYKLKAGIGGGYIIQSDHSVSSNVSPESYEYMVSLVREYGGYPLDLKKIDNKLAALV